MKKYLVTSSLLTLITSLLLTLPSLSFAKIGNGITEPGEACDGIDLNGYTCASIAAGFSGGTLSCKTDCSGYDVSQCVQGNTIQAVSCSVATLSAQMCQNS